jgi:hypothetical protein
MTKKLKNKKIKSKITKLFAKSKQKKKKEKKVKEEKRLGKDLKEMSDEEKKKFLSMDLTERMIRVEQRVSASFEKHVPYEKTEYYKQLSSKAKEEFEKYLKKNKRKKYLLGMAILSPLVVLFFLKSEITGNVIAEAVGNKSLVNMLESGAAITLLLIVGISLVSFVSKKKRNKRFEGNFDILENVFLEKHGIKHR